LRRGVPAARFVDATAQKQAWPAWVHTLFQLRKKDRAKQYHNQITGQQGNLKANFSA